jgi:hypothetical protein
LKKCLIEFFPYETHAKPRPRGFFREEYQRKKAEHRAKLQTFWKANIESQARAMARSKVAIRRSVERTRNRLSLFVNLAKIDQSIVQERTRVYLSLSSKRIKNKMLRAQERVQGIVDRPGINNSVKEQIKQARNYVEAKAADLGIQAAHSAKEIPKSREAVRERLAEVRTEVDGKVSKSKRKIRGELHEVNEIQETEQSEISLTEDLASKNVGASIGISQNGKAGNLNLKMKDEIESLRKNTKDSKSTLRNKTLLTRKEIVKAREEALSVGKSHLQQMQENLLASKELFEVDVRFAQAKVKEASKKSKVIGIQMTNALYDNRKGEIQRARARRKAQAIRNALALIRTTG